MATVVRSVLIQAPAADVWRVLTTRDLVREWAEAIAEGIDIQTSWLPGRPVLWRAPGGYARQGVVGEFVPERRLRFDYPDEQGSETFELAAEGGAVRLTLRLAGGAAAPGLADELLAQIRSLAEESAEISARRPQRDQQSG